MSIPVKTTLAETGPVVVEREANGNELLCSCCKENHKVYKFAMVRASGYELRNLLPAWFANLGALEIVSHFQSESEGNVTFTVCYR